MHASQTSATASTTCVCANTPAQLSKAPVERCMKIVVSTGGGSYLVDQVDCGSACCRSSQQYAAAGQTWMNGLDKRFASLKI